MEVHEFPVKQKEEGKNKKEKRKKEGGHGCFKFQSLILSGSHRILHVRMSKTAET